MNILSRIQNFTGKNQSEFLAFSFAFLGETLIKSAEKEVFRPMKISAVQYNVLCALGVQSPRPASEIAQFLLGSAANFSAILGRMEKEGLIVREISRLDRREIFVFMTEKGKKIFAETRQKFQEHFDTVFRNFSEDQKKQLSQSLLSFFDTLSENSE